MNPSPIKTMKLSEPKAIISLSVIVALIIYSFEKSGEEGNLNTKHVLEELYRLFKDFFEMYGYTIGHLMGSFNQIQEILKTHFNNCRLRVNIIILLIILIININHGLLLGESCCFSKSKHPLVHWSTNIGGVVECYVCSRVTTDICFNHNLIQ